MMVVVVAFNVAFVFYHVALFVYCCLHCRLLVLMLFALNDLLILRCYFCPDLCVDFVLLPTSSKTAMIMTIARRIIKSNPTNERHSNSNDTNANNNMNDSDNHKHNNNTPII